jgi:hypothetical protein
MENGSLQVELENLWRARLKANWKGKWKVI